MLDTDLFNFSEKNALLLLANLRINNLMLN